MCIEPQYKNFNFKTYRKVKKQVGKFHNYAESNDATPAYRGYRLQALYALFRILERDGPERTNVSKKIKKKYEEFIHSDEEARVILENLKLESPSESELTEKVYNHLRDALTGIDPYNAFDNLSYWLYICSENKSLIKKSDVITKIQNIGKFLSERAAYHEEWFRSINPIDDREINYDEIKKLREEFYQGISAKYSHILADTDVFRPNKIKDINTKFGESSVVIIHGASGQGKTTLAYRYLREHFPNMWRFKIELVQDRKHAFSIARAIMGHADAIEFPVAVYLDVSAKDKDWPDLISQLSTHHNIKILVTIREEDYKLASIQDFEIKFKDVYLTFDKLEAQNIYLSLENTEIPPHFLDFEEAWHRFGGEGPLLEFIYLVTQGESLRGRLKQQVTRLKDEARRGEREPGEIELLKLVSVASAFDAQLKVKPLIDSLRDSLRLTAPQRTFELFENEYLLRLSLDGSLVKGLHPIRSEILASLLTDPTISPWSECARNCLLLIYEADVESFLLYSFLRHRKDIESLIVALDSWQPGRWITIGGITRAMIWLGIMEYVDGIKS